MTKKTFKDFLSEDLDVFFNATEFAEEHSLNGEQLLCIVIDGENRENNTGITAEHRNASQETYATYKRVYIKSELFFLPKINSIIELDNDDYYVEESNEQDGIITASTDTQFLDSGSTKDLYLRAIFEVSNTSAITLRTDPSVVLATRKYVEDKVGNIVVPGIVDNLNSTATDEGLSAKQGKLLNDKHTQLANSFDNWQDTEYTPTKVKLNQHLEHYDQFKQDTESEIEDLKLSVVSGKGEIATAINDKGGTVTSSDTFSQLASAISNISTGGIELVHRASIQIDSNGTTGVVSKTIDDIDNCVVIPRGRSFSPNVDIDARSTAATIIADGTTIKAERHTAVSYSPIYYFDIVRFKGVKKIWKGTVSSGARTAYVTLPSANLEKCLVFFTHRISASGQNLKDASVNFVSSTQLLFETGYLANGNTFTVHYNVVEFE